MTFPDLCVSLYLVLIMAFWISAVCLYFRFHMSFFAAESGAEFCSGPAISSPPPTKFQPKFERQAPPAESGGESSKAGFTDCRVVFTRFNWETSPSAPRRSRRTLADAGVAHSRAQGTKSEDGSESAASPRFEQLEVL